MNNKIRSIVSLFLLFALIQTTLIRVQAVMPTLPVATSFSTAVPANRQSVVQLQGSDAEGTALTFAIVASPSHGALSGLNTSTGSVIYTPTANYVGGDSFTFKVTSGGEDSSNATVTLTVTNGKTRIIDTITDAGGAPRQGKVTFILTQQVTTPSGLSPVGSTASAPLDSNGKFDISVYPSRALQPAAFYQVWFTDDNGQKQELIGIYDIPASTTTITLTAYKVIDTNLAARYTFVSVAGLNAFINGIANATIAQLLIGSHTTGKLQVWIDGQGFADSMLGQNTAGNLLTVTGSSNTTGNAKAASVTTPVINSATGAVAITGNTTTSGNQTVNGNSTVAGDSTVGKTLKTDAIQHNGSETVKVTGNLKASGDITGNSITVTGPLTGSEVHAKVPNSSLPQIIDVDTIRARKIEGDISGTTGAGMAGGIANEGSTTVGADTLASGSGGIHFQTQNTDREVIQNNGLHEFFFGARGAVEDKGGFAFNIKAYGAKCDTKLVQNASMTAGSPSVSVPGSTLTSSDISKTASVTGAGVGGGLLTGSIIAVGSNSFTLSVSASTTASNKLAAWGTNDTSAITANIAATQSVKGGLVQIPSGVCLVTGPSLMGNGTHITGTAFSRPLESFGSTTTGASTLLLVGTNTEVFRYQEKIVGTTVEHLNLMALSNVGTTAFLAQPSAPTETSSSFDHTWDHIYVTGFDKGLAVLGNLPTAQWQFDRATISNSVFNGNTHGIHADSQNFDNVKIRDTKFNQPAGGYGFYGLRTGATSFDNIVGTGNPSTPGAAMIYLTAAHSAVSVSHSNSEQNDYFLDTAVDSGNTGQPIMLYANNSIKVRLRANANIFSIGNAYGDGSVTSTDNGTDVLIHSIADGCSTVGVPTTDLPPSSCQPFSLIGNGYVTRLSGGANIFGETNGTSPGFKFNGHVGFGKASPSSAAVVQVQLTPSQTASSTPFERWLTDNPTIYFDWARSNTGRLQLLGSQSCCMGLDINGNIFPTQDNTWVLGTTGLRWASVRATTITPGDLILSDRVTGKELYKIHEDSEQGIFFDDFRTGKRLMRLDPHGNLYVEGKVIEGSPKPSRERRRRRQRRQRG